MPRPQRANLVPRTPHKTRRKYPHFFKVLCRNITENKLLWKLLSAMKFIFARYGAERKRQQRILSLVSVGAEIAFIIAHYGVELRMDEFGMHYADVNIRAKVFGSRRLFDNIGIGINVINVHQSE